VIGEITGDADLIDMPDMRVRAAAGSERLTRY
jgi:hypothetical protein